jgi:RNA polymerase sporulation-specific sigma factor
MKLFLVIKRVWKILWGSKPHTNEVFYIGGTEVLPPPLETDEEKCCLIALVDKNVAMSKEQAKKQLIEHNLRLVVYLAKKFENTGVCVEDLISIGTIGLIKGINTFNPEKKIKLATYASRCIENEILMYLRRNNRVKLEVSFDEPLNTDWDGNELLLSDILGTDEDVIYKDLETEVEISLLKKAMLPLNERERQIIELRFGAICLILLFILLIWRMMVIANNARDLYGSLLVIGVMSHIAIQVILNIAVVTNSLPNTGVILPFISYGGTSIIFLMAEIGLVLSVSRGIRLENV